MEVRNMKKIAGILALSMALMPIAPAIASVDVYAVDAQDRITITNGTEVPMTMKPGQTLAVKGRQFEHGIGTHAKSQLYFNLPANAETLEFMAGIDDEVSGGGSVKFSVNAPDKVLWASGVVHGSNPPVQGKVDVSGLEYIYLEVDANGDNAYDHADWLNLVLTVKK